MRFAIEIMFRQTYAPGTATSTNSSCLGLPRGLESSSQVFGMHSQVWVGHGLLPFPLRGFPMHTTRTRCDPSYTKASLHIVFGLFGNFMVQRVNFHHHFIVVLEPLLAPADLIRSRWKSSGFTLTRNRRPVPHNAREKH